MSFRVYIAETDPSDGTEHSSQLQRNPDGSDHTLINMKFVEDELAILPYRNISELQEALTALTGFMDSRSDESMITEISIRKDLPKRVGTVDLTVHHP